MTKLHFEFQVEEQSMEAALDFILARIVVCRASWTIANFGSKDRLLRKLPERLRGYARRLAAEPNLRVVVLVDRDDDACLELKGRLEAMARRAGLATNAAAAPGRRATVLNRIVISELESWLLGDVAALRTCFPRLPETLGRRRGMRDPDTIARAWETLHRVLRRAGAVGEAYPKIDVARRVAAHLEPARNRSHSFQVFRAGLETMLAS